jgi:signal transduction histidine kinase
MQAHDRLVRDLTSWRADAALAVCLVVSVVALVAAQGLLRGTNNVLELCAGVAICGSIVLRRMQPQLAAAVGAVFLALSALGSSANMPDTVIAVPVFLLAYSLGAAADLRLSALTLVFLTAALQLAAGPTVFNPFVIVATVGPWAIGLVVRSRSSLTKQLAVRGRELEMERELFAAEAVRYERARIARELHDIVAHCVSVMVIQASAGQRLTATEPSLAAEAFDYIGEAARQAEAEIARLVELLGIDEQPASADGIRLIGELVARAGAAGLAVSCRFSGPTGSVPAQVADAAYRIVQESLTNAFKHAPGAPVSIDIACSAGYLELRVVNGKIGGTLSGLENAGAGRGIGGMRERVAACRGELSTGPTGDGGWRVLARLPLAVFSPSAPGDAK